MFECIKRSSKNLDKIIIRQNFIDTPPKPEKLIKKTAEFVKDGRLPAIYVDKDFILLDGYCSYLIATTLGIRNVKIVQFRKKQFTKKKKELQT